MKKLLFCGLGLAAGLHFASAAQAQPDTDATPKIENPQNRPARPNRPALGQEITPEQRAQWMARRTQMQMRRLGVTDAAQQTALTKYIESQQEAQEALREKSRALNQALNGNTVTDTQLLALLNDYNAAVEQHKENRAQAVAELKNSVNFTQNPKVEAFLTVMGLYGDGPAFGGGFGRGMGGMRDFRAAQRTNRRGNAQGNIDANEMANGANAPRGNRNRNRVIIPEAPAPAL